jgi:hypothetical protein
MVYKKKRFPEEIREYFNDPTILQKGDIVIHRLKPKGEKRLITSYYAIVDEKKGKRRKLKKVV